MYDLVSPDGCEWCKGSEEEYPERLCVDHGAEFEGISVESFWRRDRVQYAEYLDSLS